MSSIASISYISLKLCGYRATGSNMTTTTYQSLLGKLSNSRCHWLTLRVRRRYRLDMNDGDCTSSITGSL